MRRVRSAIILICIVLGCARPSERFTPGVLRYNLTTEPPTLDWTVAMDSNSIRVINNLMEGLTTYDRDLNPVPALAERWEALDGGLRYRFYLRRDVRWTDGVPLSAEDFVYSWRRLIAPRTAAQYAYFIYDVKNARALNSGELTDLTRLGVRALDRYTPRSRAGKAAGLFSQHYHFHGHFPGAPGRGEPLARVLVRARAHRHPGALPPYRMAP